MSYWRQRFNVKRPCASFMGPGETSFICEVVGEISVVVTQMIKCQFLGNPRSITGSVVYGIEVYPEEAEELCQEYLRSSLQSKLSFLLENITDMLK